MIVDEFQEVVKFILSHFKTARNRKNIGGQHIPFDSFVEGYSCLLYFHNGIESVGDKVLGDCTYAELDDEAKLTSDNVTKNLLGIGRSPSTPTSLKSKNDLMNARKAVSEAVAKKNSEMTLIGQYSRITELYDVILKCKENLLEAKDTISEAKKKFENCDDRSSPEMVELRQHVENVLRKKKKNKVIFFRPRLNMNL